MKLIFVNDLIAADFITANFLIQKNMSGGFVDDRN
jgi:hypothetical protein